MHQDDGFAFTCYLVAHLLVSYLNIMRGNSGLLWHDFLRPSILDYSHKFTISSICICCQVGRLKSCLRGPVEACLACACAWTRRGMPCVCLVARLPSVHAQAHARHASTSPWLPQIVNSRMIQWQQRAPVRGVLCIGG